MLYILIAIAVFLAWRQGRVWGAKRGIDLYRQGEMAGARYGARRVAEQYYLTPRKREPVPPPPTPTPEMLRYYATTAEEYAAEMRQRAERSAA